MQIKMDTDAVRAMSSRLRQTADSMDASLASIKATVESAGWQSQAREEFILRLEMLQRTSTQSATVLRMMAQAADRKAEQWEAIANIFNGPFYYLEGIWDSVVGFFSGLGNNLWNAITSIKLPSLPTIVLPSISGAAIIGGISSIIPKWPWNPPDWWPFGNVKDKYAGGGEGGSRGGSWGGEESEKIQNGGSQEILDEGISDINYEEISWSGKFSYLHDYRKELSQLKASGNGDSERAGFLKDEISKLDSIFSKGIAPDGPTPKNIRDDLGGCTHYVAGKRDVSAINRGNPGNAGTWNETAISAYDVGDLPVKGSILVIEGNTNGFDNSAGHVGYVESVEMTESGYKLVVSHANTVYTENGFKRGVHTRNKDMIVNIPFDGRSGMSFIYDKK